MAVNTGFILIHRKLKKHWIWEDATKLKWWLDILLSANHCDNKVLIKGTLVECKRGQTVKSLETWAKEWRTSKATVKRFLDLLENDKNIETENIQITTRITVCNYDSYNDLRYGDDTKNETQTKRRRNGRVPQTNNDNNEKEKSIGDVPSPTPPANLEEKKIALEARKKNFGLSLQPFVGEYPREMVAAFFAYWTEANPSYTKMRYEQEKTFEVKLRLSTWSRRQGEFGKSTPADESKLSPIAEEALKMKRENQNTH